MKTHTGIALPLLAIVLLAGCSAQPDPQPSTPAAAVPSAPDPAPTDSADEDSVAEPAGWTAPEVCTTIAIAPGATLSGAELGACVQEALSSYGTGKERISGAGLGGEVQFRYDPEFEFQGQLETGDGPIEMTFIDGTMWIDRGSGPVRGDTSSGDSEEQMAGVVGELYRIFSDPNFAGDLVSASAEWTVGAQLVSRELPDGQVVDAFEIASTAPFSWYDLPIDEYTVWFAEDWTPVGAQSTASLFGFTDTTLQEFYDLGEPVTITPVS